MVYAYVKLGALLIAVAAPVLINYLMSYRNATHRTQHYNTTSNRNGPPLEFFERKRVCGICSKTMNGIEGTGSLGVHTLLCGHEFHKCCLKAVFSEELKNRATCPYRYCRAHIPQRVVSDILLS